MIKKIITILLVVFMTLSLTGCFETVQGRFESYQKDFENLITDGFGKEIEMLNEKYETLVEEKNFKDIKELFKEFDDLKERIILSNAEMFEKILPAMKEAAKGAPDELKKTLEKAISKAEENIKENKYAKALEALYEYLYLVPESFEADKDISFKINQVDCSNYPTVKLFFSAVDENGITPKNLDKRFFTVIENGDGTRRQIKNVMQLDEKEGISVNMVADASGSMSGSDIDNAKNTMGNFLGQVQYDFGDTVSLTVFSTEIEKQVPFTSDYEKLKSEVQSIAAGGGTALYDTLYTSVQYTARQSGARCVIAFTDGYDEDSDYADADDVIRIANDYKIPIFIIGIGSYADDQRIRSIAENTGGFYRNINNVYDLSEIYSAIYRQQKEMYVIEYEAEADRKYSKHIPSVTYKSLEYAGSTGAYTFIPSQINPGVSGESEIETAIGNYLESYVKAMNSNDATHMLPYVISGSPIYEMQKNYVNNDYYEELLSYYITSEINMESETSLVVSVHEVYNIETPERPLYHHEQVATYRMKKDTNGIWKMYEFVGSVKNHL